MRHHDTNRKLKREVGPRRALLRSLMVNLITREAMTTTEAKAKEVRPLVEKLVTCAKNNTLTNRRLVVSRLGGQEKPMIKLFEEIAPKYMDRSGGYTRITKLGRRQGDASPMARIEFV